MTNTMRQQPAGAGTAPQALPPNMQQAVDLAAQVQAEVQAQAAQVQAQAAEQAAEQAQGATKAIVRGPDGSILIRDGQSGESIVIDGGAIPPWLHDGPPQGVFMVPIALFASIAFVIVGLPIARAFGRRMDARNAQRTVAPSAELRQLQTSIDTMAVEIERMSEHQRFLTRVLSERTGETLAAPREAGRVARP